MLGLNFLKKFILCVTVLKVSLNYSNTKISFQNYMQAYLECLWSQALTKSGEPQQKFNRILILTFVFFLHNLPSKMYFLRKEMKKKSFQGEKIPWTIIITFIVIASKLLSYKRNKRTYWHFSYSNFLYIKYHYVRKDPFKRKKILRRLKFYLIEILIDNRWLVFFLVILISCFQKHVRQIL